MRKSVAWLLVLLMVGCLPVRKDADAMGQEEKWQSEVLPEIEPPVFSIKKKFGVVIPVFNRPEYLEQTLASLKNSDLRDAMVVVVDDGSQDAKTLELIDKLELGSTPLFKIRHRKNTGILSALFHGFKLLENNVRYIVNIDADVLMHPLWLDRLESTWLKIADPNSVVSGFNTKNHETVSCGEWHCLKATVGGINLFMGIEFYKAHFKKWFVGADRFDQATWRLWDWILVDEMKRNKFSFYATKPSVIQHIGFNGLNSAGSPDVADDFDQGNY